MSGPVTPTPPTAPTTTSSATPRRSLNLVGLVFGMLFGGLLAAGRLHEYETIHAMLRLDEPDVFLIMGSAVVTSAPLLWLAERQGLITPLGGRLLLSRSRPEPHHIKGGALFGVGWAVAGTCPAPALVMISSGAALGVVALAGIFIGLHLHGRNSERSGIGDGEHRVDVTAR